MLRNEELDEAERQLSHIEKWIAIETPKRKPTDGTHGAGAEALDWVTTWGRRLISDINERIAADAERDLDAWGDNFDRERNTP